MDLTRHVATERGVAYFHKPIGAPIGGGSGRTAAKVALKGADYTVKGVGYNADGVPTLSLKGSTPVLKESSFPASVDGLRLLPVGQPSLKGTIADAPKGSAMSVTGSVLTPRRKISGAKGAPGIEAAIAAAMDRDPKAGTNKAIEDVIAQSTGATPEQMKDAQDFWAQHRPTQTDKENLSTDLGLDPKLSSKSIRELRKAIKTPKTSEEDRAALKAELARRVQIAKQASNQATSWVSNLADRLQDKPDDADLAPVIGETLAAHPHLGPLAHIWDRIRLTGFNFKKSIGSGEAGDEVPRIIARNVASVVLLGLMMHLGIAIPGLVGGG